MKVTVDKSKYYSDGCTMQAEEKQLAERLGMCQVAVQLMESSEPNVAAPPAAPALGSDEIGL